MKQPVLILLTTLLHLVCCDSTKTKQRSQRMPTPRTSIAGSTVTRGGHRISIAGRRCDAVAADHRSIGERRNIVVSDQPRLVVETPSYQDKLSSMNGAAFQMAREFHNEVAAACRACASEPSCNEPCTLEGTCTSSLAGAIIGIRCTFTSYHGDARSLFTHYRTRNYIVCEDGLRRINLRRDLCLGRTKCVQSLAGMLKARLAPGEKGEFEEMLHAKPNVLESFTIQQGNIKFWFGETGLTHPRSWSREGKNVLSLATDAVITAVPESRYLIQISQ